MGKSQRSKGQCGERELAAELSRLLGVEVRRKLGAARDGGNDIDLLGRFAVEVKRQETTSPEAWMRQAEANANGKVPLVAYRVSRSKWRVIANLEDIVEWLK